MRGLEGKRVILTGGASGIGRATTIRLVEEGCIVGIFDQNGDGAEETARLCANQPGKALAYTVDIGDYDAVRRAVQCLRVLRPANRTARQHRGLGSGHEVPRQHARVLGQSDPH
jgi:NAD(P)-dependent dehydrogenase (short-subunit alcohol dehydrogenase family)